MKVSSTASLTKDKMSKGRLNYYNTKKIKAHGITFDSKLELYFYDLLLSDNIEFEFQVVEVLQNGFRNCEGKAIRKITAIVDFIIKDGDNIWIIDTKGWKTEVAKIKYKMLQYNKFFNNIEYKLRMPKNQKECLSLLEEIKLSYV